LLEAKNSDLLAGAIRDGGTLGSRELLDVVVERLHGFFPWRSALTRLFLSLAT